VTSCLSYPNIRSALERARLMPPPRDVVERLESVCERPDVEPDGILEITKADWGTEQQSADDVLVVQTRTGVFMVVKVKGGFLRPDGMVRLRCLFEWYEHVVEDNKTAGASVMLLAKPDHDHFLLSFARVEERDRMFRCLFEAHAGYFARWGLQLDPARYAEDFDRYYAELSAKGPDDTSEWSAWIEREYGEFDVTNALGLASEWRRAELDERAGRFPAARVSQLRASALWRVENHPAARAVILQLGARLFDEGQLGPPYDERTFPDDPISQHDAGPKRLLLLMTLAGLAHAARHPRADEWIAAARAGVPAVPASVFSDDLRALWADVEELPPDEPESEIPIWADADVRAITTGDEPDIVYSVEMLTPDDGALVTRCLAALEASGGSRSAESSALLNACLTGVAALEDLSPLAPVGWRKLLVYVVSDMAYNLWHDHELGEPSGKLAQWVVATIEANHWGPDGRSTPLGQHHSYAMGVAVDSGIGLLEIDPDTQLAKAPTGDAARGAARAGHF
jgi:hypothetical protein